MFSTKFQPGCAKFEETIHVRRIAASRYVSPHSARGIRRALYATTVFLSLIFASSPLIAEETSAGSAAELALEANLYREPKATSSILGRLPRGTILTLQGENRGRFVSVEVELVDKTVEGWVDERAIKAAEVEGADSSGEEKPKAKPKRKKRGVVPTDESILLGRDPSFNYGLFLGGNFGTVNTQYNEQIYTGIGFQGGGFFGLFLSNQFNLGLQAGYTKVSGTAPDATSGGYGLLDVGPTIEYMPDRFRLYASLQYSIGIGLSDLPTAIALTAPTDVTSLWLKAGVGYAFGLSEVIDLVVKGFYGISFTRLPVGLQTFGVSAFLEFRG